MEAVGRALVVYVFLLLIFRMAGKRTLGDGSAFDLVLLLIISEACQQALIGEDFSMTKAFIVILTLVMADIGWSLIKRRSPALDRIVDGRPVVLIEDGEVRDECLRKTRVEVQDILFAARESHGLERLEQIKHAVLERSGSISIIPR